MDLPVQTIFHLARFDGTRGIDFLFGFRLPFQISSTLLDQENGVAKKMRAAHETSACGGSFCFWLRVTRPSQTNILQIFPSYEKKAKQIFQNLTDGYKRNFFQFCSKLTSNRNRRGFKDLTRPRISCKRFITSSS